MIFSPEWQLWIWLVHEKWIELVDLDIFSGHVAIDLMFGRRAEFFWTG